MKHLLSLSLIILTLISYGQKKKKQDIAAIKEMCGCYDITFKYAETFGADKDYKYHDRYFSGATEWIFPLEETKDKIVIQHLLVINDTMIIKHWRQDWLYENTDIHDFHKDRTWNYAPKSSDEVKGQWTQKVYQVDDSPRYQGSASWVHVDGKSYWESAVDAPLPRREYSKRKDYNVMNRGNRQEITDYGWVHEQDNAKVLRESGEDKTLAWEKGINTYTKVDDSKCQPGKDWWAKNSAYWADVRAVWDEVFAAKKQVALKAKVNHKRMFMQLFSMGSKAAENDSYNSEESRKEIRELIHSYLENQNILAANK